MPRSEARPPKSSHDARHGRVNPSALQPSSHADPANTAESSASAPSRASSQTTSGARSSFLAFLIGGDGTPLTFGWVAAGGAGGGLAPAGAGVVARGEGVGAEGVGGGAADGGAGVGAAAGATAWAFPQLAPRSRAVCRASRNDGA